MRLFFLWWYTLLGFFDGVSCDYVPGRRSDSVLSTNKQFHISNFSTGFGMLHVTLPIFEPRNSHRLTRLMEESHEENSEDNMGPACSWKPSYTGRLRSALREGALVGENWH